MAFSFALEVLHPFVTLAGWQFSNLEALQFLVFILWLVARVLAIHLPLAPSPHNDEKGETQNPADPLRTWLRTRLPTQLIPTPLLRLYGGKALGERGREADALRQLPIWLVVAVLLWLAVLIASTLATTNYRLLMVVFDSRLIRGVLIAWIAFDMTRSPQRWTRLIQAFALGGIVVYIVGLLEAAKIPAVLVWLKSMRGTSILVGDMLRISSTLPYPTITAMCITLTLFPLLAWFLTAKQRCLRGILGIGLLAGLAALVLTSSRGGLIALVGGLGIMAALALHYGYRRRLILLGGAALVGSLIVLIVVLIASNPALALRFISENGESWYHATYKAADHLTARPGQTLSIPVQVTNTGLHTWVSAGNEAFHLGYHLLRDYPYVRLGILYTGKRSVLPSDVAPGQSVTVDATVPTPTEAGEYVIRWDMVEERITWFSTQNTPTLDTRLSLSGDPVTDGEPFVAGPYDEVVPHATTGRLALWKTALLMVQAHPWLGVGPDNFRHVYGDYASVTTWDTNIHANNLYIEWLADTGIPGLLTFLWFSWFMLRLAVRGLKQTLHDPQWVWQLALIGSLAAWYLHGVVDYFYEFMPTNTAFWLLVGLAVSLAVAPATL